MGLVETTGFLGFQGHVEACGTLVSRSVFEIYILSLSHRLTRVSNTGKAILELFIKRSHDYPTVETSSASIFHSNIKGLENSRGGNAICVWEVVVKVR